MDEETQGVWRDGRHYSHGSSKGTKKNKAYELAKTSQGKYSLAHSVNGLKFRFHATEIYETVFKDKPWPERKNLVQ